MSGLIRDRFDCVGLSDSEAMHWNPKLIQLMTARLVTRTKEFNVYARYCLGLIGMAEVKATGYKPSFF